MNQPVYPPLFALMGSAGGGSGDVAGPASVTDNEIARFNGTTGKLLQGSSVISLQQVVVGAFNGDGDLLGTPIRFHLTGSGKIAADFPGVDSQFFATNENNVITNG